MTDIEKMLIEHECRKLSVLYCLYLDAQDSAGFASIYTRDAIYKPAIMPEPVVGRDAILQWAERYPKNRLGRHFSANEHVEVIDENHAKGRSYAMVFREPAPQADLISIRTCPRSVVEYNDSYRRTDQGWKISKRYYNIIFMEESESNRPAFIHGVDLMPAEG